MNKFTYSFGVSLFVETEGQINEQELQNIALLMEDEIRVWLRDADYVSDSVQERINSCLVQVGATKDLIERLR